MDFLTLVARAAGLIPFVMILVSVVKKFGLSGNALTVASFVIGLLLGITSEMASASPPVTFGAWFLTVCYGLLLGACACGAYDLGDRWFGPKPAPDQSGATLTADDVDQRR